MRWGDNLSALCGNRKGKMKLPKTHNVQGLKPMRLQSPVDCRNDRQGAAFPSLLAI